MKDTNSGSCKNRFLLRNSRFNYIILIYLAGIAFFTLFRLAETMAYCLQSDTPVELGANFIKALCIGWLFDTSVSCYMLMVPLILVAIGELAHIRVKGYYAVAHYMLMVLYTVCLLVFATDIPYFCFFFTRFDVSAFTLADDLGATTKMILQEPSYLLFLLLFLCIAVGWWLLGRMIFRRVLVAGLQRTDADAGDVQPAQSVFLPMGWAIVVTVVMLFLNFIGMRGQPFYKSPLRISNAYFSDSPFLNQMGLNPVFTFMKSLEEMNKEKRNPIELIDIETARREMAAQSQWPETEGEALVLPEGTNVVIVLMETMSNEFTALGSDPKGSLTPCLDSLMEEGITFTEAWSAGTQSYNGFYSTHYGHPTIFKRHSLRGGTIPKVCGLPQVLKSSGYSTTYFMAHKGYFDGLEGFMYANGFDKVYDQDSYPEEEVVGPYGIPDHLLFRHAVEHINELAEDGPFYATIATCSNHKPFIIPEGIGFTARSENIEEQATEYADWSIGQFMVEASAQPWFENTLFVFVADHGCEDRNQIYDIPLARVRIPIVFYAPGRIQPQKVTRPAMQLDVAPTILGLLGIEYESHMLGIDALKYQRQMVAFGTWETACATDGELLYIYRKNDGTSSLYRYRERSKEDVAGQYPDRKAALERYALSLIQQSYQMLMDGTSACGK